MGNGCDPTGRSEKLGEDLLFDGKSEKGHDSLGHQRGTGH